MGSVVQSIGEFFCILGLTILNFDAKVMPNILNNINRSICELFFELFSNMVGDKVAAGLSMPNMVETKASMLVVVRFDATKGRSADRRIIKTPKASIGLTLDCVMGGA